MEIVLYVYRCEDFNPVSLFAKSICKIAQFPLKVVKCQVSWAFIGELPVLRVNQFLFTNDRIVQVLKSIFNIDEELGIEEVNRNILVEEICVKKLHPGTLFLSSHDPSPTSKTLSFLNHLSTILTSIIKPSTFPPPQIIPNDPTSALSSCLSSCQTLSQILSSHHSFNPKGRKPCSTDLTVYTYLKELIYLLESHPSVQSCIQSHPNLLKFIQNTEDSIQTPSPQIPPILNPNTLSSLSFQHSSELTLKQPDPYKDHRRFFITSSILAFSTFILLNHS